MCLRPFKYLTKLVPVVDFFEFQLFHRSACDDQPVKAFVSDIFECLIELVEMGSVHVSAAVGCCSKECDLQLNRKIRKDSEYVKLGIFLQRHEIENGDLKRPYILRDRPALIHYEYVFILQYLFDRKIVLYLDRH